MRVITSILSIGLLLSACDGSEGPPGADGTDGTNGRDGTNGTNGTNGTDGINGRDGIDAVLDPNLSPLDKAFAGIGGEDALEAMTSFKLTVRGARGMSGESFEPDGTVLPSVRYETTVTYDVATNSLRNDTTKTIELFGLGIPQQFTEIYPGNLGHVIGIDSIFGVSSGDLLSDGVAATKKELRIMNPQLLLREVALDPARASDGGKILLDESIHHLVVLEDATHPITLYVNAATGRISKLSTLENDHFRRDIPLQVFFYGWKAAGDGPLFPEEVVVTLGEDVIIEEDRLSVETNTAIDPAIYELPETANPTYVEADAARGAASSEFHRQFAASGFRFDGLAVNVVPMELAPGVFFLGGSSHNSMAVEQSNGVVIFEPPLYNERSEAVIAWARAQFPMKSITHLIVTHFHDDHIGGLRPYVAIGATIVAGESSIPFYRELLKHARSTIIPDSLAMNPVDAVLLGVPEDGTLTLDDVLRPIEIHPIDNTHARDMIAPFLPNEQLLFNSDLYSPGFPPLPLPWAAELYDSLDRDGVRPVTIAGGHAGVGTIDQLRMVAGR